jgi:hypothetical protein
MKKKDNSMFYFIKKFVLLLYYGMIAQTQDLSLRIIDFNCLVGIVHLLISLNSNLFTYVGFECSSSCRESLTRWNGWVVSCKTRSRTFHDSEKSRDINLHLM